MNTSRNLRYYLGSFLKSHFPSLAKNKAIYSNLSFTRDVSIDFDGGKLFFACFNELMSNSIFYTGIFGDWEGKTLNIWFRYIQANKPQQIYDIGSFVGIYSILASKACGTASIHAFEPNPKALRILKRNLRMNLANNIEVHEHALSNRTGNIDFYNYGSTANPSLSGIRHHKIKEELGSISLNSLDINEFVKTRTSRIDLIKMDIERAELELLRHGIEFIKEDRPVIFIEILDVELYEEFNKLFKNLNYRFIKIDDVNQAFEVVDDLINQKKIGANWIFCPRESFTNLLPSLQ